MSRKLSIAILVLIALCVVVSKSYACGGGGGPYPPVAILYADPTAALVGTSITLDGSDSYPVSGSITKYEWDWTNNDSYDYNETPGDGIATHTYDTPGTYTVKLRVTNSYNLTDTDTCTVTVGRVNNTTQDTWHDIIQDALDEANNGDEIVVVPSTYYENINFNGVSCTLTSTDPNDPFVVAATIIDGNDTNSVVTFDSGEDANAVLTGFTITNGNATYGGGIYDSNSSPTITRCLIIDNDANYGGGMYNTSSSSPTVKNCIFTGNQADANGGAIYDSNSSPVIINCTFTINTANSDGGGMYNTSSSSPTIKNCIFAENAADVNGGAIYDSNSSPVIINCTFTMNTANSDGGGMYNYGTLSEPNVFNSIFWGNVAVGDSDQIYNSTDPNADPNFSYCLIDGCGGSVSWDANFGSDGGGNKDSDPCFVNAGDLYGPDNLFGTEDDGLQLRINSPCIDAADGNVAPLTDITSLVRIDINDVNNDGAGDPNYADMGAYELSKIWYVDKNVTGGNDDGSSWTNAYDDLQDALNDANVAVGDQIWVAKGTYYPTDGTSRSVSFELIEDIPVYGGFDSNDTGLLDRDWTVNVTTLSGDIGTPSDANDNSYHVVKGADDAVLDGFTITLGNADSTGFNCTGGGMFNLQVSPIVQNCVFSDNYGGSGGAMYNHDSNAIITNCVFSENKASNGGALVGASYPTPVGPIVVTNCVFCNNEVAYDAGGIFIYKTSLELTNCTFTGNSAGDDGGGLYLEDLSSNATITNCIFWGNTASSDGNEIYDDSSDPNISYSDIEGGWNGPGVYGSPVNGGGNIDADPYFVDSSDADGTDDIFGTVDDGLRLGSSSPCIDAADGDSADLANIVGLGRVDISSVTNTGTGTPDYADIGAFEFAYVGVDGHTTIGNGRNAWEYPMKKLTHAQTRTQVIYLAEELGGADTFTSLALDIVEIPPQMLSEWTIRMKHTSKDDYSTNKDFEGNGWTTVYRHDETILETGWATFEFDTPFDYDGASNLMIDFSYNNSSSTSWSQSCRYSTSDDYRSIYAYGFVGQYGDPCTWTGDTDPITYQSNNVPNIKLRHEYHTLEVTPADNMVSSWPGDVILEPTEKVYILRNNTTRQLGFSVTKNDSAQTWYDINDGTSATGYLAPNESTTIMVSINNIGKNKSTGNYSDSVIFTDLTNSRTRSRDIDFYVNKNIYVDASGGSDATGDGSKGDPYATVQKGIDMVDSGRAVIVNPGTYNEAIDFGGKALTLTSTDLDDPSNTIIQYDSFSTPAVLFNNAENADSVITGFKITNPSGPAISFLDNMEGASPTLTYCEITDSSTGLYCENDGCPLVEDCNISGNYYGFDFYRDYFRELTIRDCNIIDNSTGINCSYGGNVVMSGCIIRDNGKGIVASGSDMIITNCTIVNNTNYGVWTGSDSWFNQISNCIIWNNGDDLYHCSATYSCIEDEDLGSGNFSINPQFVDDANDDYHLLSWSWCVDAGDPSSDYSNEPYNGGGRVNMGAYGNTPEAAAATDEDGDGIADEWELYYWPDDDPCDHNPGDNPDSDDFNNLTEYLFGYDPNNTSTESMELIFFMSCSQFDPTKGETFTFDYLLNMTADVDVSFKNTDTEENVRTISKSNVPAGLNQMIWDGDDANGVIVERAFYDVAMDADDNDGNNYSWTSPDGGWTSTDNPATGYVETDDFDPYKNIPAKIHFMVYDWCNRTVDIVEDGCQGCRIYRLISNRLVKQGWNTLYWYGRWDDGENAGQICQEEWDVYFHAPTAVKRGAVVVYYETLSNLRCNPYHILPVIEQVTTISYDLACDANVTIDFYDPNGYFGTLSEQQEAGPQEVIWYGTTAEPNDPNSRYISNEGIYRIEVQMDNIGKKYEATIAVYK